jgi:membrane-bound metal-dependent hydrolase YbcI (DUF457 family)
LACALGESVGLAGFGPQAGWNAPGLCRRNDTSHDEVRALSDPSAKIHADKSGRGERAINGGQHAGIAAGSTIVIGWGMQRLGADVGSPVLLTAAVVAVAGSLAPDLDHPHSLASFTIPSALLAYGGGFLLMMRISPTLPKPQLIGPILSALPPIYTEAAWVAVAAGLVLLLVAFVLGSTFGHRGLVHSVGFGLIATLVFMCVTLLLGAPAWWALVFAWGWATHLAADATTHDGLPDVLWPIGSGLLHLDLRAPVRPVMPPPESMAVRPPATTVLAAPRASVARASEPPLCPRCGIPMVLRTAKKGEHMGRQFWGCRHFPRCRQTRQLQPGARADCSESPAPDEAVSPEDVGASVRFR